MSRVTNEWIGTTDDSKPPPRVRLRVFAAYDGRCWLSGRKITPSDKWDLDHRVALVNSGENREKNLAPAIRDKHREKTAEDVAIKSKINRIRARHLGLKPKGRGWSHLTRKFDGTVSPRKTRAQTDG